MSVLASTRPSNPRQPARAPRERVGPLVEGVEAPAGGGQAGRQGRRRWIGVACGLLACLPGALASLQRHPAAPGSSARSTPGLGCLPHTASVAGSPGCLRGRAPPAAATRPPTAQVAGQGDRVCYTHTLHFGRLAPRMWPAARATVARRPAASSGGAPNAAPTSPGGAAEDDSREARYARSLGGGRMVRPMGRPAGRGVDRLGGGGSRPAGGGRCWTGLGWWKGSRRGGPQPPPAPPALTWLARSRSCPWRARALLGSSLGAGCRPQVRPRRAPGGGAARPPGRGRRGRPWLADRKPLSRTLTASGRWPVPGRGKPHEASAPQGQRPTRPAPHEASARGSMSGTGFTRRLRELCELVNDPKPCHSRPGAAGRRAWGGTWPHETVAVGASNRNARGCGMEALVRSGRCHLKPIPKTNSVR